MRISEPNKLVGKIIKIKDGQDMTEVIVDVGDLPVMATITSGAAGALDLNQGDEVFVMFNSTDVTIVKDTKKPRRDYGI